jgi:hypothetical protein
MMVDFALGESRKASSLWRGPRVQILLSPAEISAFGEHQVTEGRTGELTEARLQVEAALAAYTGGPE